MSGLEKEVLDTISFVQKLEQQGYAIYGWIKAIAIDRKFFGKEFSSAKEFEDLLKKLLKWKDVYVIEYHITAIVNYLTTEIEDQEIMLEEKVTFEGKFVLK